MSGGKGSADGRIGSGKGVRAALGQEVSLELIRSLSLPGDLSLVSGVVCDATLKELSLNTREGIVTVNFSAAARRTNIRNLVNLILATNPDDRGVTCLIHGSEVVCLWPEDNWLQLNRNRAVEYFRAWTRCRRWRGRRSMLSSKPTSPPHQPGEFLMCSRCG